MSRSNSVWLMSWYDTRVFSSSIGEASSFLSLAGAQLWNSPGWTYIHAAPHDLFVGVCAAGLHFQAHAEGCQPAVWHWWHRLRTLRWPEHDWVKLWSCSVRLGESSSCPCPPGAQLGTCHHWLYGTLEVPCNLLEGLSSSSSLHCFLPVWTYLCCWE